MGTFKKKKKNTLFSSPHPQYYEGPLIRRKETEFIVFNFPEKKNLDIVFISYFYFI